MENSHPYVSEMKRLQAEVSKALDNQNIFYANDCMDKLYALSLDASFMYARYISRLEETLGRVRRKETKEEMRSLILNARRHYSEINQSLRRFQVYQQAYGLTNTPKE
jgi:flagellar biosynthesis chaperone FliJ